MIIRIPEIVNDAIIITEIRETIITNGCACVIVVTEDILQKMDRTERKSMESQKVR